MDQYLSNVPAHYPHCKRDGRRRYNVCTRAINVLIPKYKERKRSKVVQRPDIPMEQYVHFPQVLSTSNVGVYPRDNIPGISDLFVALPQPSRDCRSSGHSENSNKYASPYIPREG